MKGLKLSKAQVQKLYDAQILRDNFLTFNRGMLSTVWALNLTLKDRERNSVEYEDIDVVAAINGINMKMWSSSLFQAIIMDENEFKSLPAVDEKLDDKLVFWDNIPKEVKRVKDGIAKDGSLTISGSYECIGAAVGSSKLKDMPGLGNLKYAIPFYGFIEGVTFLNTYNKLNGKTFKSIRESFIKELVGRTGTYEGGEAYSLPNQLLIRDEYGANPYLSNLTPIFKKV